MKLTRTDTTNLWDKTYILLKDHLEKRTFSPNQKLSVSELASQLGVSRTPVRDALNRLEMEGLVKTVSKVGTFVVAVRAKDLLDIMDTRLMLELWTADKISLANRSAVASVISRMGQILNIASDMILSEAFNSYLRADHNLNFHLEFMKIGNNHKHIELYQSLMNYRYLTMRPAIVNDDMIRAAQSQHEAIVEAMKGGNTSDVKRAVSDHMGDSTSRLLQAVEENGGMI